MISRNASSSSHGEDSASHPQLQSQWDCVLQPSVARHELPWVCRVPDPQLQRGWYVLSVCPTLVAQACGLSVSPGIVAGRDDVPNGLECGRTSECSRPRLQQGWGEERSPNNPARLAVRTALRPGRARSSAVVPANEDGVPFVAAWPTSACSSASGICQRLADCKSAIRQIENLRDAKQILGLWPKSWQASYWLAPAFP
jgi:hypothetical protein